MRSAATLSKIYLELENRFAFPPGDKYPKTPPLPQKWGLLNSRSYSPPAYRETVNPKSIVGLGINDQQYRMRLYEFEGGRSRTISGHISSVSNCQRKGKGAKKKRRKRKGKNKKNHYPKSRSEAAERFPLASSLVSSLDVRYRCFTFLQVGARLIEFQALPGRAEIEILALGLPHFCYPNGKSGNG
jgi:hypothetical protein